MPQRRITDFSGPPPPLSTWIGGPNRQSLRRLVFPDVWTVMGAWRRTGLTDRFDRTCNLPPSRKASLSYRQLRARPLGSGLDCILPAGRWCCLCHCQPTLDSTNDDHLSHEARHDRDKHFRMPVRSNRHAAERTAVALGRTQRACRANAPRATLRARGTRGEGGIG